MNLAEWTRANRKARDAYHHENHCPDCGAITPLAIFQRRGVRCDYCTALVKRAEYEARKAEK